jgi:pyrroline-5-carboxylate reductase
MNLSNPNADILSDIKIGIVGCGHLGQAMLEALLSHGFIKENIYISYTGNPSTFKKLEKLEITICLSENEKIFNEADIIFLTVRPQDVKRLQGISISKNTIVVSCLAGVPIELLKDIFNAKIFRMMVSGPNTIVSEKGIATVYPYNELVSCTLKKMSLHIFEVLNEIDLDIFTTGVCLPAALLLEDNVADIDKAVNEIGEDYAGFLDIYEWAKGVLPTFYTESEKIEYISKMITKGGVTEAIINSIKSGETFITALRKGISRSQEISQEISHSISGI